MAINVTTTSEKVTATVADEKVQATVSGGGAVSATVTAGFGAVGPSGVIAVTAPITNTGTSTAANVGISLGDGLSVSGGSLRVTPGTYATLVNGLVPAGQLPSYVDDVLEYANLASLPEAGETGKIYVTLNTGKIYRWSGSAYFEISASPGSTDVVPEGSTNLYFTNARARNAFGTGTNGQVITWSGGQWTAATPATYTLPTASQSVLGGVKIGSGITITDGVISASSGYTLPTATNSVLGGVKIGSGVSITDGVISVATNYLPLSGGEMDEAAAVTLVDGANAVQLSGLSVNVVLVGSDEHATLEYTGLAIHDGTDSVIINMSGVSFADGSQQTTAFLGSVDWATQVDNKPTLGTAAAAATTDFAAASHSHGNITNAGAIGSTSGQIVVTTTGGALTTAASISTSQVSGLAASATTDTTNAANISSGTLPEGRLPNALIVHPFLLAGM